MAKYLFQAYEVGLKEIRDGGTKRRAAAEEAVNSVKVVCVVMQFLVIFLAATACASRPSVAPSDQTLKLGPPVWVPSGDPIRGGVFIDPFSGQPLVGR